MRSSYSLLTALILALLLNSCGSSAKPVEDKKEFVINDSVARLIKIDTVKTHGLEGSLELNGTVTFNENTVVRVMPLVTGTVENVNVQLGDYVTQGQTLATIRSGELAELQNTLAASTANLKVARKNLEVANDLAQKGINSQKDVLEAQQEVDKDEAEVSSATKKLSIIGGSTQGGDIVIKAPVNGYIVERKINPNQVVDENNDDPMFTVSDLRQVWVIASVYETDIEKVKVGESVKISTIAYPDKMYTGTINYVSNVLDPDNKTMKVRVVLNNANNELKPEMFAKVILDFKDNQEAPCIPKDAVVFDDNKNYVVVYHSRDSLEVREISLYPVQKDLLYIRSGLEPGETIIGKNQLIIYNALTAM
ncbi:MAG TPA: efflux RND transporter periplasmic adaptor subunit [Chitinophagales bacterium]|nr:efflux RND transporter periplasmic adaptor subunit [Chitinophagales bacterium]